MLVRCSVYRARRIGSLVFKDRKDRRTRFDTPKHSVCHAKRSRSCHENYFPRNEQRESTRGTDSTTNGTTEGFMRLNCTI